MTKVRVTRPHAMRVGVGVYKIGDVYEEQPYAAQEKARSGFVEILDKVVTKESREVYDRISVRVEPAEAPSEEPAEGLTLVSRVGNWYNLSDGTKVLGKRAAAEKLGVSVEEVEDVNPDDD